MKSISSFLSCKQIVCFLFCLVGHFVHAEVIADFTEDFSMKPKAGWSYLWNPAGVDLGNREGYRELETFQGQFVVDASNPPMHSKSGTRMAVSNAKSLKIKKGIMVPGNLAMLSTDDRDHYAITAYTIQTGEDGEIQIVNSRLEHVDKAKAVRISIYVNDREIASDIGDVTTVSKFDISLGTLKVGDTVYLAIGPTARQWSAAKIQFQLKTAD